MSALPSPDPVSPYILLGMTATTGIVDAVSPGIGPRVYRGHGPSWSYRAYRSCYGFRNAMTRKLGVPDLTTTVLTLTITGLAADSFLAGGTNPRWRRRVASVQLMCAGAAVGGVILQRSVAATLCLCGIASIACALAVFERFPHSRGGDSRSVPPAPESSKI